MYKDVILRFSKGQTLSQISNETGLSSSQIKLAIRNLCLYKVANCKKCDKKCIL